jgi:hypothetical protein
VCLDLVVVAAAVLLLDDVAGLGQVGDDAVGAALPAWSSPASACRMPAWPRLPCLPG